MNKLIFTLIMGILLTGCRNIEKIFESESPHDKYRKMLIKTGAAETTLGSKWIKASESSLNDSLFITLPYHEEGYFFPDEAAAVSYRFNAMKGEKILVDVEADTSAAFKIFIDLFTFEEKFERVEFADEESKQIEVIVEEDNEYLLRLQPELLNGGNYLLTIKNAPSLAFPIFDKNSNAIKSFWGDKRDGGTRIHQGVDIFAPRNTPVTAAANGVITRTGTNNLGGKVVWLFAEGKSFYYAHLDSQLVSAGEFVDVGDTLGLIGNTGNAKHTLPHLHFGIYIPGRGAVDPLPFIKNVFPDLEKINVNRQLIGELARIRTRNTSLMSANKKTIKLNINTPVIIYGASGNRFRIMLPDGRAGFISAGNIEPAEDPVTFANVTSEMKFFYLPDEANEIFLKLVEKKSLPVLGIYNGLLLISHNNNFLWVKK